MNCMWCQREGSTRPAILSSKSGQAPGEVTLGPGKTSWVKNL